MKKLNQPGFSPILIILVSALMLAVLLAVYLSFQPGSKNANPSPTPQTTLATPQPSGSPAAEGCIEDDLGGCDTEPEGDDPILKD